jgi:hypothetical protein
LIEDCRQRRARVLHIGIDAAAQQRLVRDSGTAKIESPLDGEAFPLDHLRNQFAEDDLLREILRADNDVFAVANSRRPNCRTRRCNEHQCQDHAGTHRASSGIGKTPGERERAVTGKRQERCRNRTGENHRGIHHRQDAEDVVAEAARADRRCNRRRADADHHRHAKARHD